MHPRLKYYLALSHVDKIGPVKARQLIEKTGSIEAACSMVETDFSWVEAEIERADEKGIKIYCAEDEDYPENLKNIYDPPLALYVKGDILPQDKKALAIVGTRAATSYGHEIAGTLARELSSYGITIVSGLALGIDAAAHAAATRTIAVFGAGVNQVYPPSNRKLADQILTKGAWVSEFPIGMTPEKWTFPQRNRIISGLSLGVIVVEGEEDSGALITAKIAAEQGREVFAVPGNIQNIKTRGPHSLIKQGAKLVETTDDILEELKMILPERVESRKAIVEIRDYSNLNEKERKIIDCIIREPKHIDKIAEEIGFSASETGGLLAMLEIKKTIKQLPGKFFAVCP
ncbi:DNA protecting protein DprA [candidate division WOR-1 bacterium RIFOXYA12_FULL_43_27]|uniref:DNA protecting protein DprA n=1 Tax=candidate division WOR-1 bacterium RIFOXYC2_FULL_46_14 TaxID=1802587 RepID=A0A1F4U906_UNCSA|nr:MAG: DNA protecting protein DprA [candidate division WOR-1 bacterium RIFOXYA12_FULL_43_27]OGC19182.1 MAG: DNA protecting protein DprA [candidate division WOR-1 bacterium RIFOXYB2_FULL_46_45]OGC30171.1 MAG: DNA protecting protein DprA [candidate division WOR-1 bacterium RIFOXYA2_FULL_46_56]OGC40773.1 MAG: DNA protecting protein DprA [candidate division WOR-1 bacterium RIFOXYC2_FULL_46_14]